MLPLILILSYLSAYVFFEHLSINTPHHIVRIANRPMNKEKEVAVLTSRKFGKHDKLILVNYEPSFILHGHVCIIFLICTDSKH